MTTIKNPFFMTALMFFILGIIGIALNLMTGLIILTVGLFTAVAGVFAQRRGRRGETGPAAGSIRLNSR
jgi:hypothetical protein